jgi:hypothetical protein
MSQEPDKTPAPDASQAVEHLKAASKRLKDRIEEEKRRRDLPIDSNLGDPKWEERAKDGHLDLAPEDEEE